MGSPTTWPPDLRKRLRAARGYAGLSLDELASKTALGRQTIFRMESGERGHDRIREMELREIARVCGLPYGFFTADFSALETEQPTLVERVEEMIDAVDQLVSQHAGEEIAQAFESGNEAPPYKPGGRAQKFPSKRTRGGAG